MHLFGSDHTDTVVLEKLFSYSEHIGVILEYFFLNWLKLVFIIPTFFACQYTAILSIHFLFECCFAKIDLIDRINANIYQLILLIFLH